MSVSDVDVDGETEESDDRAQHWEPPVDTADTAGDDPADAADDSEAAEAAEDADVADLADDTVGAVDDTDATDDPAHESTDGQAEPAVDLQLCWSPPPDSPHYQQDEDGEAEDPDTEIDAQPELVDDEVCEDPAEELDRILAGHLVHMMYQPITALLDDSVVGYEALARGPHGSPLATPKDMFAAAAEYGRTKELDLLCQTQAVVQARDVLLKTGHALFVNVLPEVLLDAALGRDPDAAHHVSSLLTNVTNACPVVLEISDSHPYRSAADLLAVTAWARGNGFRVALDDVAVGTRNLAVLPLIEPDVIKLSRTVLSASPDADLGLLLSAVRAQSERTGAAVVCQGIESEADHDLALSVGATHAEGYAIGYPEELSEAPIRIRSLEPVGASWGEPCSSPFELVASSTRVRTGSGDLVEALTLDLERQAGASANASILAAFERGIAAGARIGTRYEKLAKSADFVVALGADLGRRRGVFHGSVADTDPLQGERVVVVMTPQFSAALLARLVRRDHDGTATFAFAQVDDRGTVTRAARMLMAHIDVTQ